MKCFFFFWEQYQRSRTLKNRPTHAWKDGEFQCGEQVLYSKCIGMDVQVQWNLAVPFVFRSAVLLSRPVFRKRALRPMVSLCTVQPDTFMATLPDKGWEHFGIAEVSTYFRTQDIYIKQTACLIHPASGFEGLNRSVSCCGHTKTLCRNYSRGRRIWNANYDACISLCP